MSNSSKSHPVIPIIDLFAGPGGLGEGFSRLRVDGIGRRFEIKLSIEKDLCAHKTLTLRAFYRQFPDHQIPREYYEYLRGEITREALFEKYPRQAESAFSEAKCLTLGEDDVSSIIARRLKGQKHWLLIGGPPCQAYSLVGRSRMLGGIAQKNGESEKKFNERKDQHRVEFETDHRHKLYREYLKIIGKHWPSVFVMENVKGILSAKLDGELIFPHILNDLRDPARALKVRGNSYTYTIHSLSTRSMFRDGSDLTASDYLIRSEEYGVPQARHRVILLGIRDDIDFDGLEILEKASADGVKKTIDDLPKLTSGVSKQKEVTVFDILSKIEDEPWWQKMAKDPEMQQIAMRMAKAATGHRKKENRGGSFVPIAKNRAPKWHSDPSLGGACNHETRTHIVGDLWRYVFCASYAQENQQRAPQLRDFPEELLPAHKNVKEAIVGQKFGDRFRVQVATKPATTVTSHISKDGHYFIHYDPAQCRSLTVREAARLQTFPDNYFFEGPRTQQFHQVGNAVPPYLAYQIAEVVGDLLDTLHSPGSKIG